MRRRRWVHTTAALATVAVLMTTGAQAAAVTPEPGPLAGERSATMSTLPPSADERAEAPATDDLVTAIPQAERDETLGSSWASSGDRVWTLAGDISGLQVMVADAAQGYAWRTVASLSQPGVDTDRWVGNGCATESGERLVVAYAPRSFTNDPELFRQGAWTAVVDLRNGSVTELAVRGSLEYFTPSCGHDERAVVTISGGEEVDATRLVGIDAASAVVDAPVQVDGQVTSAVPTGVGLIAAVGRTVAHIEPDGRATELARAASTPYELSTDRDGGVVFLEHDGTTATARRLDPRRLERPQPRTEARALATGPLGEVGVTRTADGEVLVTGEARASRNLPAAIRVVDVAVTSEVSLGGDVLVDVTSDRQPVMVDGSVDATEPLGTVRTRITSRETGRSVELDAVVQPDPAVAAAPDGDGDAASPAPEGDPGGEAPAAQGEADGAVGAQGSTVAAAADGRDDPVDDARGCSVPVNSVHNQAMQPKPRQVEWAVNQAVKGALTVERPGGWKNLAMPRYTPQGMFPPIALSGGGEVPSQVMLGILAQESNLWQAPGYVVPGVTGSPLVGNYYGIDRNADNPDDLWDPNFIKADCGYGVAQVTDGMRRADTGLPGGRTLDQQRAIALDFAANVSAGLRILQEKWNQTRNAGLTINDGNPARIENWYFAVWAYNSGFYPEADKFTDGRNGAWGVGWLNNPVNPSFAPNRGFFHAKPADATHPQDWPYPEKVIGFAAFPPSLLESPETFVPAYRAAWWPGDGEAANRNRADAKPPVTQFCQTNHFCDIEQPTAWGPEGELYGACQHKDSAGDFDGRCWYNGNATWKTDCANTCGRPFLRFPLGYAYQDDGTAYPAACTDAGLPDGALVVDDVPATTPVVRAGCTRSSTDVGTFELQFSSGADPSEFPSKMDLNQLGAGYGGHFWFGHTRNAQLRGGSMEFTGTWTLGRELQQWTRVLVHLPDHGAHTRQAQYVIDPGDKPRQERTILQRTMRNGWVSLGVFEVDGVPSVSLSTETPDGDFETDENGDALPAKNEDIAFDAVAFVPLAQKPTDFVVALGDSYSSGEGAATYYPETDFSAGTKWRLRDGCHRSPLTWSRVGVLPSSPTPVGARADALDSSLDYHLLACAGATASNVWSGGYSRFGELPQLDRGFLDDNTTLVTLSIGGNDAGFTDVFLACIALGAEDCQDAEVEEGVTRREKTTARIEGLVGNNVEYVLDQIHDRAPNAKILLMGYPPLISGQCDAVTIAMNPAEVAWLNSVAGELSSRFERAKEAVNARAPQPYVVYADPAWAFAGRGVCGNPELIHSGVFSVVPPDELLMEVVQSFHPKEGGYVAYGDVMSNALSPNPAP